MQDIYFDNIRLKNVRCHENIDMSFPTGQFTAVIGKNGKGKSTIPKAMSMVLYGEDQGTTINDMVNKKVGKNLEIVLSFRIQDSGKEDKYEIQLYHAHSKFHNKLVLLRNGVDISGKTKTETYKIISQIYLPKNIHHNVVYFAQQVKDFFTALSNTEQKDIFNSILSLSIWEDRYIGVDSALTSYEEEESTASSRLLILDSQIPEREGFLTTLISEQERRLKEIANQIVSLNNEITDTEIQIVKLETEKKQCKYSEEDEKNIRQKLTELISSREVIKSKIDQIAATTEEKRKQIVLELHNEFLSVLNKGKSELESFFNKQRMDENNKLKLVMERMTQVSKQFSCDDLEAKRKGFLDEKRKEQRFVDSEVSKLDIEFDTSQLYNEKTERIKNLTNKKTEIEKKAEKLKNVSESAKKDISKLEDEIKRDQTGLDQDVAICSKCGQPLNQEHRKKIVEEIEANQRSIESLLAIIDKCKKDFIEVKKDYDEITILVISETKNFDQLIFDKEEKKRAKKEDYSRKRELIDREISVFNEVTEVQIQKRKDDEISALNELGTEKDKIEENLAKVEKDFEAKVELLKERIEKDSKLREIEQIENLMKVAEQEKKNQQNSLVKLNMLIENNNEELRKLQELKSEVDNIKTRILSLDILKKTNQNKIKELESFSSDTTEIDKIKVEIEEIKKDRASFKKILDSVNRKIELLNFWKEGFSDRGIKSMLIDSAIPFMNKVCKEELEKISGGKFIVSFDTLSETKGGNIRDKLSVHVLNCETGADRHELLSGGEKRLIDLCCMKALRALAENQYQKKIHMTIFDEALDALDDDNSAIFCRLMKQMSADQNVMIITHKVVQNMEADEVLKL